MGRCTDDRGFWTSFDETDVFCLLDKCGIVAVDRLCIYYALCITITIINMTRRDQIRG